ncbi:cytochrome o ubiquinol oxidase subunit III [Candidatus Kaiserbacteria bacterium]|nr:cytochrome o ubiquinol oxidase subunit III [Candidatus Kaiserbacteria bacterium]
MTIDHPHDITPRVTLGFWIYLMSDCVLFASLFATYAVLHGNTYGGPSGRELFSLTFVLAETLILLTSSFTVGLAMLSAYKGRRNQVIIFLAITLVLGLTFIGLELNEFVKLVHDGNSWTRSAFLSSFFTLVGTHGLHVTLGSLWMMFLIAQTFFDGLTEVVLRRLLCLTLFWHFLDIVWIFIFTIVYLMGTI